MKQVLFVDTDVILDLLMERQPHFGDAARLFMRIQAGEIHACTSALVFANIHYILGKATTRAKALDALRRLRLLLDVLPVGKRTVDEALVSGFADFEDALQHSAAVEGRVSAIVTRNRADYRHSTIPVLSAGECVSR